MDTEEYNRLVSIDALLQEIEICRHQQEVYEYFRREPEIKEAYSKFLGLREKLRKEELSLYHYYEKQNKLANSSSTIIQLD